MATQRDIAALMAQRQRLWDESRANLLQSLDVGNPRAFAQGIPRQGKTYRSPLAQAPMGQNFQAGRMPNDMEVRRHIESLPQWRAMEGRMRQMRARLSPQRSPVPQSLVQRPGGPPQQGMMQQMAAQWQAQADAAKAANLARYDEGHQELSNLRLRNQEGIGNWGHAQAALNTERAMEALGAQAANLQGSGILNSNVFPSFAQRSARDLSLVNQELSERRDARSLDADTRDTNSLVGFVERRNDTGPDMSQLMQLAMKYGQGGGGAGGGPNRSQNQVNALRSQLAQQRRPLQSLPRLGGGLMGGVPIMLGPGDLGIPQLQYYSMSRGSNRYPRRRGGMSARPAPPSKASAQDLQAWYDGKRVMPGSRRRPTLPSMGPMYA